MANVMIAFLWLMIVLYGTFTLTMWLADEYDIK